jgi:hypothetical protein
MQTAGRAHLAKLANTDSSAVRMQSKVRAWLQRTRYLKHQDAKAKAAKAKEEAIAEAEQLVANREFGCIEMQRLLRGHLARVQLLHRVLAETYEGNLVRRCSKSTSTTLSYLYQLLTPHCCPPLPALGS